MGVRYYPMLKYLQENWFLIMVLTVIALWRISAPSYRGYYGGFRRGDWFRPGLTFGRSNYPERRRKEPEDTGLPPRIPHEQTIMSPDWNKIEETEKHDQENINEETKEEAAKTDAAKDDDVKIDFLRDG